MIEAYQVAVSLIADEKKLLGPLAEGLRAFERINAALSDAQERVAGLSAGLRGAASAARSLATAMERVARASAAGSAGGGGSGGRPASATDQAAAGVQSVLRLPSPGPLLALPPPGGGGGGALVPPGGGGSGLPPLSLPPGGGGGGSGLPPLSFGAAGGLLYRGMAAAQVVEMVVGGIGRLIESAKGLNDQLVVLQQRGVSQMQAEAFEALAYSIARNTPGRDLSEIIKDAGSLRSVLGEKMGSADPLADVKAALPEIEKTASALSSVLGLGGDTAMHMLMRAVELRGGIINPETHKIDPARFQKEMEAVYKTLVAGGGLVSPNDLLNVMQQAGPMARMMPDPDEFYASMLSAVLDMKGNRAGTALTAAGRQLFGGRMSLAFADEMAKLGLIPKNSYHHAGAGYITLDPAAQKTLTEGMQGGLFKWVVTVLKPKLMEHGFTTDAQQQQELYKLFATETFRRLAGLFLQNAEQVLRDQKLLPQVLNPDAAIKLGMDKSIGTNIDALNKSVGNFFETIEKANAPAIISTLQAVRGAIDLLTDASARSSRLQRPTSNDTFGSDPWWSHSPLSRKFWLPDVTPKAEPQSYAPPAGSATPRVQTITYVQLNGRTIAKAVSEEQARDLTRPLSGTNNFDGRRFAHSPGQPVWT